MRHVILLALLVVVGCENKAQNKQEKKAEGAPPPPSSIIKLDYETTLWTEYGENVAAADSKYKGKEVETLVRGKVESSSGKYFIGGRVVSGSDEFSPGVVCWISQKDTDKLSKAKQGTAFKIRGVCNGKKDDPKAFKGYIVTLDDCRVVQVLTWNGKDWVPE